jgi:hypothetical protein
MEVVVSTNIRTITPGKGLVSHQDGAGTGVVNYWAQAIEVAQPTLDAIAKLQPARDWLADMQRYSRVEIELGDAWQIDEGDVTKRLAILPEVPVLQEAAQLLDDAVRKSAPEGWFHLAISAMLHGRPNAKGVSPGYACELVDMLLYDHEARERGCEPGFSAPIFVSALRKTRRESEFVPSAAAILKECKYYRQQFRNLAVEVEVLIELRQNAEEAQRTMDWQDDGDFSQNQEMRARWDSDIPFTVEDED